MFIQPTKIQHSMLVLVPAQVGGCDVLCLFDTGAACSVIDSEFAEFLVQKRVATAEQGAVLTARLRGADGTPLQHGSPVKVPFLLDGVSFSHVFTPVANLQAPILLGPDFMHTEGVVIDLRPDKNVVRLTKRNLSIPFRESFKPLTGQTPTRSILHVSGEPVTISPHKTKVVQVEHTHNDPYVLATRVGFVRNRAHNLVNQKYRVIPGVTKFEKGKACICVQNIGTVPVYLDGFSAIAEAFPSKNDTPLEAGGDDPVCIVWSAPFFFGDGTDGVENTDLGSEQDFCWGPAGHGTPGTSSK